MALDCEMDMAIPEGEDEDSMELLGHSSSAKNPGLLCKVSLVNQYGEIVVDTLVDYRKEEND